MLSEKSDKPELYDFPQFSKDGKGVYVVTDHDSDFRRLAYIESLVSKDQLCPLRLLNGMWRSFSLRRMARTWRSSQMRMGLSKLHLFDLLDSKEHEAPQLPVGIISDPKWNRESTDVAFNLKSPRSPIDVYSVNLRTGKG